MRQRGNAKLAVVDSEPIAPPPPKRPASQPTELGLYAEVRAAANDRDRWRRMHERSARREPVEIGDRPKLRFLSRGGFKFELREHGHKFEERL
jgi:hypothetical protein